MNEEELWALAEQRKVMDERLKWIKTQMTPLDARLINELKDRRTKRMEHEDGLKITLVVGESVEYPYDQFVRKFGADIARELRPDKIDKDKLAEAINDGIIDPATAAQLLTVTEKSPYIRVT